MRNVAASILCFALSFLVPSVVSAQSETPEYFTSPKGDAAQLASAVNHFVELGETKTIAALKAIRSKHTFSGKIDVQFRLACVCRVLWQNSDHPIPHPRLGMYGGGVLIGRGESEKLKDWPMFPVANEGKSYFVVVCGGRSGTGNSHRLPLSYLKKCQDSGSFLAEKIPVPTKRDAEIDAKKLRQSARWGDAFPERGKDRETWRAIDSQIPNNAK